MTVTKPRAKTTKLWGYKLVNLDLTTDDHKGGRLRYRLGEWMLADPEGQAFTSGDCPAFPGDGLCIARTVRGATSGGATLTRSLLLLCGYNPADVLCDSGDKIRVTRLLVHPDPYDPIPLLVTSGAYLSGANPYGANLSGAYLYGAYLYGANLSRANLSGAYLSRATGDIATTLPDGWKVNKAGLVVKS
ncbi:MAG: pentapeptide repeat-containing protein [Nitrospirota bacterium]